MNKNFWAIFIGIMFLLAGINHFVMPGFYLQIMPPYLPFPMALIYLSGLAEIICGALFIPKQSRRMGAWLIILLLIAVFPANIQMSIDEYQNGGWLFYGSVLRLPLQFLFIWWSYKFTK
ncbi:DoxX family protein [Pedobacter cryophilus]|uniref:DoxX family membrane protein n=1 Tax=Pedobacter cryophilus TaxID=2571271 RepID=A0A4U1BU56_9SPHI|nr:MauE/DoxX family redox-associated membrane protein [Pedobacter cryophilus]TKB96202.1 DoxX family membrane protein [Pedobacter cryophilus]